MDLPEPNFMLCIHLLPANLAKDASIDALRSMADKLESCQFKAFWTECGQQKAVCDMVAGFHDKIRDHVAFVVSATYQLVSRAELEGHLDLKGKELDALIIKKGWTVTGDDVK
ncbi:COP9 signalosome, partial [Baffinella frigidus]